MSIPNVLVASIATVPFLVGCVGLPEANVQTLPLTHETAVNLDATASACATIALLGSADLRVDGATNGTIITISRQGDKKLGLPKITDTFISPATNLPTDRTNIARTIRDGEARITGWENHDTGQHVSVVRELGGWATELKIRSAGTESAESIIGAMCLR